MAKLNNTGKAFMSPINLKDRTAIRAAFCNLRTAMQDVDFMTDLQTSSLTEFDRALRDVREIEDILNRETSILLSSV